MKFFANAYTPKGIPDILACINGHFVAIEVKADDGRVSELQKINIDKINSANGFAFALYPSKFGEFKTFIDDLLKGTYNRDDIPMIWR